MGAWPLALALGIACAACDKSSGSSATARAEAPASASATASASAAPAASSAAAVPDLAAQAAEDELVADELQSHHRHHHAGFAGFVISSVETLGIGTDQQAAVDVIRKDLRAAMKPLHEANRAVLQLLADGIAAGSVDKAKVDAAVARVGTAAVAVPGATQDLLNKLHGVLRPEQRAALVDKVDAHWAAWRDANTSASDSSKSERHVTRIAKDLSLTREQIDRFRASLDATKDAKRPFDAAASEAYMKAFDAALVADTFDAKKLPSTGPDSSRIASWGAERMGWYYEALAPILTPDQRTQLADKLRQRTNGSKSEEKP